MKQLMIFVLCALFMTGCFRERNEVIQKDSISQLKFTGSLEGASFTATKDGQDFYQNKLLAKEGEQEEAEQRRYQIPSGVYIVRVYKAGAEIVSRKIYVSDDNTFEIYVP